MILFGIVSAVFSIYQRQLFIKGSTNYIKPSMWIIELADRILDKVPGFLKFFKSRRSQKKLEEQARLLWPELKDYVLDMKHYFESEKTVSFCYILQRLGQPTTNGEDLKAKAEGFRQLHQRAIILASWYFSVRRELEIDNRKPSADSFSWKVYAINSFLSDLGYQLVTDLNNLLHDKNYLNSRGIVNDYSALKDGYNLGLTRWENFLKKCNREISSIQPKYFIRLE